MILSEELEFLDTAWRSLDEVFQGSAAEEFTGFWTRTLAEMEDSRLEVQKILNFFVTSLYALFFYRIDSRVCLRPQISFLFGF